MENTKKDIGFEVKEIRNADRENYVIVYVKYPASDTIYTYIRKIASIYDNGDLGVIIDGCCIRYNPKTFKVVSIIRLYETSGRRRTKNFGKYGNKGVVSSIKKEMKEKELPSKATEEKEPEGSKREEPRKKDTAKKEEIKEDYDNMIVHHEKYETIKTCLENNIPVYLAGPTGSGKNHTVEQIAYELDWDFYFSNSVQQEYKLTGFIDAGGRYHETEFYKACTSKKDCIFFLDEMDSSIPEVLVLLNAAIANGYFEFPTGRVELEHIHFVAAGNTVGNGADELYTGRMVLDQATLDRFAIIDFDYSLRIEMAISRGNAELVSFVHQLRYEALRKGIRATFSYRCMTMVTKLERSGLSLEEIMKIAVVKGLDKDTIMTLQPEGETKYHKALNKIKLAA